MYLNIHYERGGEDSRSYIHVWDDITGYKKIPHTKYAYKLDENGGYVTLYGQPCKLVKRWKKEDVQSGIIYESDIYPEVRHLVDTYTDSDIPSNKHIIMFIDIEVSTDGGIPNAMAADNDIISLSHYITSKNEYVVYLVDSTMEISNIKTKQRGVDVIVKSYVSEEEMLVAFLEDFVSCYPTVITGWNTDYFDIPYLYNRLFRIFGEDIANTLSPINIVHYNEYREKYFIAGISSLDYLSLYKKFTAGERMSYSLDSIGKLELNEGKIVYEGSLQKLYEEDKEKFIEYNLHDVRLVKMIDDKMQFIDLAIGVAHKGHVAYEDVFYPSRYLDGCILTYLKRKGKVVAPNKPKREGPSKYESGDYAELFSGAYVKEPVHGLHKWLVDLDVTSMYPSIIMSLNISPESKVTRIENWDNSDFRNNTDKQYVVELGATKLEFNNTQLKNFLDAEKCCISSNGVIYKLEPVGIIPEILDVWFEERKKMRSLAVQYGKELNKDGTINLEYNKSKYEYYDRLQKIQKVLLNSLYGVLGLPSFRYFDLDNAAAVTTTGVDLIQFSSKIVNHYLNAQLAQDEETDNVIYIDTDSLFFSLYDSVKKRYPESDETDEAKFAEYILKLAKDVQFYVNKSMDYFAKGFLNVKNHRFMLKQELVAKAGLWTTKKRYALATINKDGIPVDELEVKGLDIVRASFPSIFKKFMKKIIYDILHDAQKSDIDEKILTLHSEVKVANFTELARPMSVKNILKYAGDESHQPFTFKVKGTPVHVKASINYNDFLRYYKLDMKYSHITDNFKIKWVYLRDNPLAFETLAFKDNDDDPKEILEYIETYIDRDKIFEAEMGGKLQDLYNAISWNKIPNPNIKITNLFF